MAKATIKTTKTEELRITWLRKRPSLSQIYHSGLEYCFVSKDNKQCCPFVLCKDFLQDAVMAMHHGKSVSIYGFEYDPKQYEPISMDHMKMAITNSVDAELGDRIPNMIDFLHQFERKLRLIRTRVREVKNPPKKYSKCGVYLLDGSNRWLLSPPLLSMYTLLIRMGFTHKKGDKYNVTMKNMSSDKIGSYQTQDINQLNRAKKGIERILKCGYLKIFFKDPIKNFPDVGVGSMHNSMGICAFSDNHTRSYVKHWHRNLDKRKKAKKGDKACSR